VVGPQLHHQVPLYALSLATSIVAFLGSSAFTSCTTDGVLTRGPQQALQPSFTPRRIGGRDESVSRINVELCACAYATE
jgi:hypothetical protein